MRWSDLSEPPTRSQGGRMSQDLWIVQATSLVGRNLLPVSVCLDFCLPFMNSGNRFLATMILTEMVLVQLSNQTRALALSLSLSLLSPFSARPPLRQCQRPHIPYRKRSIQKEDPRVWVNSLGAESTCKRSLQFGSCVVV